jgi:hypothetical protein
MAETNETGTLTVPVGSATSEDVFLPASDALDEILGESLRFDQAIEDGGEAGDDALGKTQLETRAEVPALTRLHHERRVLARALAPLAALFEGGQNPPAEAKRKQHRNVVATLIAAEQGIDGDKVESKLERLANADQRHIEFCDRLETLRIKYFLGKVALLEKTEEIRDREEAMRAYNAELRAGILGGGQV